MKLFPTQAKRLSARNRPKDIMVMRQDWSRLLFLHWEFPVETIQQQLPNGLYADTFEGKAYIGLVPFYMEKIRPVGCPPVPGISWFKELNLRTYVYDERGELGVWFFTLECNQWLAVKIARLFFHLPYHHAKMAATEENNMVCYTSRRKGDKTKQQFDYAATSDHFTVAEVNSIEFFLLERYRLYSMKNGNLYEGMVHHSPYQYEKCEICNYSTRTFSLCDFDEPSSAPISSMIADKVSVEIFPLRKVKVSNDM